MIPMSNGLAQWLPYKQNWERVLGKLPAAGQTWRVRQTNLDRHVPTILEGYGVIEIVERDTRNGHVWRTTHSGAEQVEASLRKHTDADEILVTVQTDEEGENYQLQAFA
ncbi:hypothetical protein GCM10007209_09280 [Haloferax sulfurifontis]|uniref:Uncharacterized protein n=2 Tax=Haloferax sulfurifontis TaxID=255616 RepID=A0A830DNM4_9EURY|nr:hypothetical protein GCM10007209_09280 [Haloferax sulfurifontis]